MEDEYLVAAMLESFLQNLGVSVVGPAHTIEAGLRLAREEMLHGAILDVNVRDKRIDPIADVLSRRDVPFALATGYSGGILEGWQGALVLAKPYTESDVARVIGAFGAKV